MYRPLARMGVWKSDMVGCGRAGEIGGRTKEGMVMAKACRIHKHMSTTAAGNKIGAPGAKDISVALAKCSNLHSLNLSGQWVASCLGAVRWKAGFARGLCRDGGRIRRKTARDR